MGKSRDQHAMALVLEQALVSLRNEERINLKKNNKSRNNKNKNRNNKNKNSNKNAQKNNSNNDNNNKSSIDHLLLYSQKMLRRDQNIKQQQRQQQKQQQDKRISFYDRDNDRDYDYDDSTSVHTSWTASTSPLSDPLSWISHALDVQLETFDRRVDHILEATENAAQTSCSTVPVVSSCSAMGRGDTVPPNFHPRRRHYVQKKTKNTTKKKPYANPEDTDDSDILEEQPVIEIQDDDDDEDPSILEMEEPQEEEEEEEEEELEEDVHDTPVAAPTPIDVAPRRLSSVQHLNQLLGEYQPTLLDKELIFEPRDDISEDGVMPSSPLPRVESSVPKTCRNTSKNTNNHSSSKPKNKSQPAAASQKVVVPTINVGNNHKSTSSVISKKKTKKPKGSSFFAPLAVLPAMRSLSSRKFQPLKDDDDQHGGDQEDDLERILLL